MLRIRSQQGGTLIVGLIFLLVLSVIGVTGMNVTSMEERMARNARDRDLAFQAADSALRAGEDCIMNRIRSTPTNAPPVIIDPTTFTCNTEATEAFKGFYSGSLTAAPWRTLTDTNAWNDPEKAVQFPGNLAQISSRPSYVVEQVGIDYGPTLESPPRPPVRTYRITAHATGGTPDAVTIVQSTVRRN